MANGMINACDLCGQCRAACPNGFDYPAVCAMARRIMVETEKMPPSAHEFGLLDQQFSCGEAFLSRPQPGAESCRYLFFPGCQAAAVSPETVEAAYRTLRTAYRRRGTAVGLLRRAVRVGGTKRSAEEALKGSGAPGRIWMNRR
ncbi:MAG: hypothetical protein ACLUOI_14865 [Eisenbergiella sp.]